MFEKIALFKRKRAGIEAVAAEVTRSAALSDAESEAAVASSVLFARVRAGIEKGERRVRATRSAPALAVGNVKLALSGLMIAAALGFWLVWVPAGPGYAAADQGLGAPAPLTACSISATAACAISTGDVLQLLLSDNVQELPK